MKQRTIFKKILAGVGIVGMLFGVTPVAQVKAAANYDFTFNPPFEGCGRSSSIQKATGNGAYVCPSVIATKTTYCVISEKNPIKVISDYVKTGETWKEKFTYKAGYGGSDQDYMLYGYPSSSNFSYYNVYGKWEA